MKITIKSLALQNFKGIRHQTIVFNSELTNIYGGNGTGKTTIFDAFLWLLFGKDSTDRKDFEVKTLDANNKPYHKLEHEVKATIEVDGDQVEIRRVLRENWVTKRGEQQPVFSGHTTAYFWNDVPLKLEEYQTKIGNILNEATFKLLTNAGYFNQLKWQDRRNVLIAIAGKIDDADIFDALITPANKNQYTDLINALNAGKTIDEYKRQIAAKKKKLRDELDQLPGRIDEANRSLPDPVNYNQVDELLQAAIVAHQAIENQLLDKTEAQKQRLTRITGYQNEIHKLRTRNTEIANEITNTTKDKANDRQNEIAGLQRERKTLEADITRLTTEYHSEVKRLEATSTVRDELRKKWEQIQAETLTFNEAEFSCPACKRAFEAANIEEKKAELTKNFNTDKSRRLTDVTERGNKEKTNAETIEANIANVKSNGEKKRAELEELTSRIQVLQETDERLKGEELNLIEEAKQNNGEIIANDTRITDLLDLVNEPETDGDNSALMETKRTLQTQCDQHRAKLSTKDQLTKIQARIDELKQQESEMAAEFAGLEGTEFIIEQFTKAKMDALEASINSRFTDVQFKMFEEQINGGQTECCETLIKGVPYSDANNAAKINAGLDIINVLSEHYQVSAPVFVDNAESVNQLNSLNSQLIRLVVSTDEKLRIEADLQPTATKH